MVSLIILERVLWRLHGDSVESDTFYGDMMAVKLVWILSGVSMERTWQTPRGGHLNVT